VTAAFWALLAAIAATYVGYAALVLALAAFPKRRARGAAPAGFAPRVALVVPAHDEEAIIEAKLRNFLALDYPCDRLEAVVISDGSTDATCERVRSLLASLPTEERRRVSLIERSRSASRARLGEVPSSAPTSSSS
jgi:cellulose synthase/poly-beta-1,6-N-acetylglucosamine synthase-like glycosyltransferase